MKEGTLRRSELEAGTDPRPTARSPFQSVFVFDHGFGNLPGHWPNFHRVLVEQCRLSELEVAVLGYQERDCDLIGDLPWRPFFHLSPATCLSPDIEVNTRLRNLAFLQDLRQLSVEDFGPSDIFLFTMVMNYELEAILKFAESFPKGHCPAFIVLLQFDNGLSPPDVPDLPFLVRFDRRLKRISGLLHGCPEQEFARVARLYRQAFKALQRKETLSRIAFMAPADGLDELYARVLGMPVHPYCMPFVIPDCCLSRNDRRISASRERLTVGFLGHSCIRKGLHFVPSIIAGTRSVFPDVRFEVQVNYNHDYPLAHLFDGHFSEPADNVIYHFGHIENDEYFSVLDRADVVLMPYSKDVYRYMPSGLLREAIAFGKVIVVPDETSLSRQARSVDAGAVTFGEFSADAATKALIGALSHFESLREKADMAAARWTELHNSRKFLRQLMDQASRVSKLG
jgi:glycosyltransferase involved in cell wall biosynthesis